MARSRIETPRPAAEPATTPPAPSPWVPAIAAVAVVAHLAVAAWGPYELHRDALLYLAWGEHLRLFRMDAPPFIALVAEATRALLGDGHAAIRTGPALAHGALILLAAATARLAGGRAAAQALTALAVATAPLYLRAGSLFQPVVFDQLWWTLALYALARIGLATPGLATRDASPAEDGPTGIGPIRPGPAMDPRLGWLLLGVALGLGLLTKFTSLVLGAAILAALLATPLRKALLTPWPWVAAGLALLIGSPSVAGQLALGAPFLAQFQDLEASQLSRISPTGFVAQQLLLAGPAVLLGATAALALVAGRGPASLRAIGWATTVAFLLMMAAGGKGYYIGPIWPALIGIGASGLEQWTARLRARRWVAGAAGWWVPVVAVAGFGAVTLPLGLPFLPPPPMARYAAQLGVTGAVTTNTGEVLELPQDYADMLGWRAMAAAVTEVWRELSPEDRARGVILATNYGRAGAIDFYGGEELPPVIAPVGSYWFWGPGDRPGEVVVVVGAERAEVLEFFRSAVEVRRLERPWGVPEERDVPIVIGREPIATLQELWPRWAGMN